MGTRSAQSVVTLSILVGSGFLGAAAACGGAESPRGGTPTSGPTVEATAPLASATPSSSATAAAAPSGPFEIDATFADRGVARLATRRSRNDVCAAALATMTVTADAIYIAGSFAMPDDETLGGCDAGVMKISKTGKLDASFGKGGVARVDAVYGFANSIAVAADGKITAAGAYLAEGNTTEVEMSIDLHFAAMGPALFAGRVDATSLTAGRFTPGGALDPTFANKGALRFRGHPGMLSDAVLLGSDGSTTIVGGTKTPKISDDGEVTFPVAEAFAFRLGADGQVDKTFGAKGVAYFDAGKGKRIDGFVSRAKDGALVFAGHDVSQAGGAQSFLVRTTPEMKLDATYGTKGFTSTVRAMNADALVSHLDGRDGAVVATVRNGDKITFGRIDAAGKADTTWGTKGVVILEGEPSESNDIELVRGDGSILHFVERPGESALVTRIDQNGKIDPEVSSLSLGANGTFVLALVREDPAGGVVAVYMNDSMELQVVKYKVK